MFLRKKGDCSANHGGKLLVGVMFTFFCKRSLGPRAYVQFSMYQAEWDVVQFDKRLTAKTAKCVLNVERKNGHRINLLLRSLKAQMCFALNNVIRFYKLFCKKVLRYLYQNNYVKQRSTKGYCILRF